MPGAYMRWRRGARLCGGAAARRGALIERDPLLLLSLAARKERLDARKVYRDVGIAHKADHNDIRVLGAKWRRGQRRKDRKGRGANDARRTTRQSARRRVI